MSATSFSKLTFLRVFGQEQHGHMVLVSTVNPLLCVPPFSCPPRGTREEPSSGTRCLRPLVLALAPSSSAEEAEEALETPGEASTVNSCLLKAIGGKFTCSDIVQAQIPKELHNKDRGVRHTRQKCYLRRVWFVIKVRWEWSGKRSLNIRPRLCTSVGFNVFSRALNYLRAGDHD